MRPGGQLIVNDATLAGAAMRAGAGLGYALESDVAAEVAAGHLVQVLDGWCTPFQGYHLYYLGRQTTPALRALVEALRWRRETTS